MRLPLHVHWDHYGHHQIVDGSGRIVCRVGDSDRKFATTLVRMFNRDWRFRWFGFQPYEYTREDWLFEKNVKA